MGATATHVIEWVVASGLRLIAVGLVAGAIAAWGLGGALAGLLIGVAPSDATKTVGVLAAPAAIGTIATLVPSWRAMRVVRCRPCGVVFNGPRPSPSTS